jgi:hypothetical protein
VLASTLLVLAERNSFEIHSTILSTPKPTASNTARSTEIPSAAANINLGANTFQTIRCLLKNAALAALLNVRHPKYIIIPSAAFSVFFLTCIAEVGCGSGGTFQSATSGLANPNKKVDPNVLRITNAGENGYVKVEVRRNADFHCIDGIVDWCPVPWNV